MPTEQERFGRCLALTLAYEGGWSDHPSDPGGATMKGVTLAVYRTFKNDPGATKAQLRAISDADLNAIYRRNYWLASSCDKLPAGVDLMTFDVAVNSGPSRARRWLQEAVGSTPDGVIGPQTLARVLAIPAPELVQRLSTRRDKFYRSLGTFPTFGKGWLARLKNVTTKAMEFAR